MPVGRWSLQSLPSEHWWEISDKTPDSFKLLKQHYSRVTKERVMVKRLLPRLKEKRYYLPEHVGPYILVFLPSSVVHTTVSPLLFYYLLNGNTSANFKFLCSVRFDLLISGVAYFLFDFENFFLYFC